MYILSAENFDLIHTINDHSSLIRKVIISPNDKQIISLSYEKLIVHDFNSKKIIGNINLYLKKGTNKFLDFSYDNKFLVLSIDHRIVLYPSDDYKNRIVVFKSGKTHKLHA